MKVIAIIVAAGKGKRIKGQERKQFIRIDSKPLLAYTLDAFEKIDAIDKIILVIPVGTRRYCRKEIIEKYGYKKKIELVCGGEKRQDSVSRGLRRVTTDYEIVLIHDGVRPFVTQKMILDCINGARKSGACIVAVPVVDTIKVVSNQDMIKETLPRKYLFQAQTPQAFKLNVIKEAYAKARKENFYATDDSQLVERLGKVVRIIPGDYCNIKITTREDLILAERLLAKRESTFSVRQARHT